MALPTHYKPGCLYLMEQLFENGFWKKDRNEMFDHFKAPPGWLYTAINKDEHGNLVNRLAHYKDYWFLAETLPGNPVYKSLLQSAPRRRVRQSKAV